MFSLISKITSAAILICTALALNWNLLPPYFTFTAIDGYFWSMTLTLLAIGQLLMVTCIFLIRRCYNCRLWSDFLFQMSGMALILLASIFGMMYPPFSWAMVFYPVVGVTHLLLGRKFAVKSRTKLWKIKCCPQFRPNTWQS